MLRDCGLPQVRTRSPKPDSPVMVSRRAPSAVAEAHHLGEAPRDQRGVGARAKLLAHDDACGDGVDILERAADLGAGKSSLQ